MLPAIYAGLTELAGYIFGANYYQRVAKVYEGQVMNMLHQRDDEKKRHWD